MRHRQRRGVEAYYSVKAKDPKLHFEISCEGLRYVRVSAPDDPTAPPEGEPAKLDPDDHGLGIAEFPSMHSLGLADWTRPCRMCALERVLDTVLRPTEGDKLVFATFTSQPAYVADSRRFVRMEVSATGRDRLLRIAERLALPVTTTMSGPAAYGLLPERGVRVLQRNLRTQATERITTMPSAAFVATFWTFVDDAPPELVALGADPAACDPWQVAELIIGG